MASPAAAVAATPTADAADVVTTRVHKDTPDNMCLTASGGAGEQVYQAPCGTDRNQYWDFVGPYYVEQGGLYYLVRNGETGLCLEQPDGSVPGSPVVQQPCDTAEPPANAQAWGITSGDSQSIETRLDHLNIRLPGGTSGAGAVFSEFDDPKGELEFTFLDEAPRW